MSSFSILADLKGHTEDQVWHLSWSYDGLFLASCGVDKVVRIWGTNDKKGNWENPESIRCISTLEDAQTRTIRSCEWSPEGNMIACASFDGTVVVWESQDKSNTHWDQVSSLEGHENEVKSVSWSADGMWLATCGRDKRVWIWEKLNDNEFECISMLEGHTQDVKFILWHPSSTILFSCSYDDTIKIWGNDGDGDDWRCIDTLIGHNSTVWSLGISYDGQKIISCSDDLSIVIWECDGRNGVGKWRATSSIKELHSYPIYSVNWNHHTNMITTGGGDNSITLCKIANSCDGGGLVLENKIEEAHKGDVNCVRWNPNEELSHILASCGDDGTVRLWLLT